MYLDPNVLAISMAGSQYETLKDNGNQKFKTKNYEEALNLYTQALSLNENGLLAYSNRAMCHINLGRFYEAIEDCDKAISLDPKFSKAYYRRAIANKELYRFRDAIVDMKRVVELDPKFELAEKEMKGLLKQIEDDNRIEMKIFTKPSHIQSTKPIKCFQILNQYTGSRQYD